jgi:hypothetical protein
MLYICSINDVNINKVQMEINNKNRVLEKRKWKAAYNMLPHAKKPEVRQNIIDNLGIHENTFYKMMNGHVPMSPVEQLFVEGLFKKWNIDVWSGEFLEPVNA